ncbi:MAG TPA: alkaline phosphatase family protein [Terriglobales bacterium]|nr:alkaline phosphatase family protein [Terriglobales bacterium]
MRRKSDRPDKQDANTKSKISEEKNKEIRRQEYTRREALALIAGATVAATGCRGLEMGPADTGSGGGSSAGGSTSGMNNINHVVFMFQENRSFDHYFGKLNEYRIANGLPGNADCAAPGASNPTFDFSGNISSFKLTTQCIENVSPAWNETHVQIDTDYQFKPASEVTTSRMNGFVYTGSKYAVDFGFNDTSGARAMGYYDHTDLPYYYWLATQFATSDRWFSPVPANSPPNRLFSFAATSAGYVYPPTSTLSQKSIFHLLEAAKITWKIYVTEMPFTYLSYFQPFADEHKANVVDATQFATDCANGTLPSVAFIEAGYVKTRLDEHPGNNIQVGAAYVASLVNALMNSPSWKDSAFFLSYDEGGGLYDHVPPPVAVSPDGIKPIDLAPSDIQGDFNRYGLRVPAFVVSPYARPGYVSHTVCDHTAILKFIETRWGLPNLTERDKAQPNLMEFFDFSKAARLTPPTPPAQPISGPCYYDRVP